MNNRLKKMNPTGYQWRASLLLVVLALMVVVLIRQDDRHNSGLQNIPEPSVDRLVYTVFNYDDGTTSLMLYEPDKGKSTPILVDVDFRDFSFSVDGRLAFSSGKEGNGEIYVIDIQTENSQPISLTQNPATYGHPLAWSPDGHYLAFESFQSGGVREICVWDGEQTIVVTPEDMPGTANSYRAYWSNDGRLVFEVFYGYSSDDIPSEIYLWDGHKTVSLSQNPTGEDRYPAWSADGQVAFLSDWNGDYDVFVWDGVSVKNGIPNRDTFTNVAPDLTAYYSRPAWTNTGLLSFGATPPQEHYSQIFVWDGQTATNISDNPGLHNGSQRWHDNGDWAFATFFSSQQLMYVRDKENQPLLTVEGYSSVWNSDGYLIFCHYGQMGWILSLWDRQRVIEIVRGYEIRAQWQSGSRMICSSG
jgi:WD40 repeat protein